MRAATKSRTKSVRAAREPKRRDAVVNLRMTKEVRDLIDNAAALLDKTRTDFIVESSRKHAIDVLLDRRLFTLKAGHYDAFVSALDTPPVPNEKLKRLLASKSPWQT
jgi:uncharacterized protein (DUF1778 family)